MIQEKCIYIHVTHYKSSCVHWRETGVQSISEIIIGLLPEEEYITYDTDDNKICIYYHLMYIHSSLEPIVGAGRPAEIWSRSSLLPTVYR